jgi:ABC-2 type transport system ATP-binding protein
MSYAIETHDLTKRYPVMRGYRELLLHPFRKNEITALQNVNIQVKKGEMFGLLGPNGAGKTTLIKILCTLVLPTSGNVLVNGLEVTRNGKETRKSIGYVIGDERSFYWRLSGKQNLRFFAKLNNIPDSEAVQRIDGLLHSMDLAHDADRLFKDYSTGMRQKLAIVRGLLTNPAIIFMDEPTNGLDPVTAEHLKKLVKERLVVDEKRTVVYATHNLLDAEELCDRLAIIQNGEIKVAGSIQELKMEFNKDKRYVITLKNDREGLLNRIENINSIHRVVSMSNGHSSDNIQIEVEIVSGHDTISGVIREIMNMGGKLCSLCESETSLGDLFKRIMDTK